MQYVPHSKHSSPQLYETNMLMFCKVRTVRSERWNTKWTPCRIFILYKEPTRCNFGRIVY